MNLIKEKNSQVPAKSYYGVKNLQQLMSHTLHEMSKTFLKQLIKRVTKAL